MNNIRREHIRHSISADVLEVSRGEVYRYLGYGRNVPEMKVMELVEECVDEIVRVASPAAWYTSFEVSINAIEQDLEFMQVKSKSLGINLKGCSGIYLMAATIGPRVDQLIQRSSKINQLKGIMLQACGAATIEAYVELINDIITNDAMDRGYKTHIRYSPGYGDLPLECQKDIFNVFDMKRIGLTLMESCIMAPSKSVTAIIGLESLTI